MNIVQRALSDRLDKETIKMLEEQQAQDMINHPPHYNSSGIYCECDRQIECIDITRHMNFNLGNTIKYIWRHKHKGGLEDLKKALWYLSDEIEKHKP